MEPPTAANRSGFGLRGLIVLPAVLAILAGTVGPLLFEEGLELVAGTVAAAPSAANS